jgi:hypothetical protein
LRYLQKEVAAVANTAEPNDAEEYGRLASRVFGKGWRLERNSNGYRLLGCLAAWLLLLHMKPESGGCRLTFLCRREAEQRIRAQGARAPNGGAAADLCLFPDKHARARGKLDRLYRTVVDTQMSVCWVVVSVDSCFTCRV